MLEGALCLKYYYYYYYCYDSTCSGYKYFGGV